MSKFDAAIRTLKSTLGDVDEYGVVGKEADETEAAIRVLEAAAKVPMGQYHAIEWRRSDGVLDEYVQLTPEFRALLAALPDDTDAKEKP